MFTPVLITVGFLALFTIIEAAFGLYRRPGVLTMRELGASLLSLGTLLLTRSALAGGLIWALGDLWPHSRGALAGVSFWLTFPFYVLLVDYRFYWLHRKSHEWPWLWRLHKPHHAPPNMHAAITYRENWIFNLLAPNAWLAPLFVWFGQPGAYLAGSAFGTLITLVEHCDLRWDLRLQQNRFMRPVMWVLERIITLPDTHHVHHGVGRYGDAMKNYGAALSCFDLIHGTLVIPHARQEGFGLPEGAPVEPWAEQLFWPLVRSTKEVGHRGASIDGASPAAALAAAKAVIHTADGRTVVVR